MKIKTSAIILVVASGLVILFNFVDFLMYFESNPMYFLRGLFIPIALLILGISLLNKKTINYTVETETKIVEKEHGHQILSIGDWLVIFLITIIPLVGLIFLIIWANDENNKIRKNYAAATLIWWGISILFAIFLFTTVLSSVMSEFF